MTDRLTQLTKLYQADPNDPFCAYGIALEHAKAERTAEALTWLDKTLALDAHYAYAYYQKARLLVQQGHNEQAKEVLRLGMQQIQPTASDATKARAEMQTLLETIH